jgi:hypothetical protein
MSIYFANGTKPEEPTTTYYGKKTKIPSKKTPPAETKKSINGAGTPVEAITDTKDRAMKTIET